MATKKAKTESRECRNAKMLLGDEEYILEVAEDEAGYAEGVADRLVELEDKACAVTKTQAQRKKCMSARMRRKEAEREYERLEEEADDARTNVAQTKARIAKACGVRRAKRAVSRKTRKAKRR